jgi:hypothetical protein
MAAVVINGRHYVPVEPIREILLEWCEKNPVYFINPKRMGRTGDTNQKHYLQDRGAHVALGELAGISGRRMYALLFDENQRWLEFDRMERILIAAGLEHLRHDRLAEFYEEIPVVRRERHLDGGQQLEFAVR